MSQAREELGTWRRVLAVSHVVLGVVALVPMLIGGFLVLQDAESSTDKFHGLGMALGGLAFAAGAVPLAVVLVLRWWLRTGVERAAAGDAGRLRAAGVAHVVAAPGLPLLLVGVVSMVGSVLSSGGGPFGVVTALLAVVSLAWGVLFAVAGWKVRRLAGASAGGAVGRSEPPASR